MEAEASSFESSEMLATFLASTPLLSESWKLCDHANTNAAAPGRFVAGAPAGGVTYVAFSGVQAVLDLDASCRNLVALDAASTGGLFSALHRRDKPAMVHAGFLQLFLSLFHCTNFQNQISEIMKGSKSIVFTGHSIGGTLASLSALWLLSYLQSTSSSISILCITFGSPLLGNEPLSRAILQQRWGGNFCHVVAKHDPVPRLLFAPLAPLPTHLHSLLQHWQSSMASPFFRELFSVQLSDEEKEDLFGFALGSIGELAMAAGKELNMDSFWPLGSYLICTKEGAICLDNAMAIIKLLHLMLATGSASSCIEDHLKYGDYVGNLSFQFRKKKDYLEGELPAQSSYDAGITLALQSSEISNQESVFGLAKDCLRIARRLGRAPNLNSAKLSINMARIMPLRAQIEWYKELCDKSDDRLGYYDTFKQRGASKKDAKININRIRLSQFWDDLIHMLETNQLPHDFHLRAKYVNSSQFYKLLVEPLDIAEYYRTGMHRVKGHYLRHGRERRYEIFDRWWRDRKVGEEENYKRSTFASLTQDTCFWARVEEAKEWLESVRNERVKTKLALLWENLDKFEHYAKGMVERMEVSKDVVAENSSYRVWVREWSELKSQLQQFPSQFSAGLVNGGLVP